MPVLLPPSSENIDSMVARAPSLKMRNTLVNVVHRVQSDIVTPAINQVVASVCLTIAARTSSWACSLAGARALLTRRSAWLMAPMDMCIPKTSRRKRSVFRRLRWNTPVIIATTLTSRGPKGDAGICLGS